MSLANRVVARAMGNESDISCFEPRRTAVELFLLRCFVDLNADLNAARLNLTNVDFKKTPRPQYSEKNAFDELVFLHELTRSIKFPSLK